MVSHRPHLPSTPIRLIVIALALSVLLHVWLLATSVPNWNKIQMPEPETISVRLAPPAVAPVTAKPAPVVPAPQTVTPPPRHEPARTVRQPPLRPHPEPRPRPQTSKLPTAPMTQTEHPAPAIETRPTPPPSDVTPAPRATTQTIPPVKLPPAARPQRPPRTAAQTAPSRGGPVDMGQLRSQLSGIAADDSAPPARFSKITMTYPGNCTGSCRSYALSLISRLSSIGRANRLNMENGDDVRVHIVAVIGPDGSIRSASIAGGSGNGSMDSLARRQTLSASMPPFPADMAARASSLRITYSWHASQTPD